MKDRGYMILAIIGLIVLSVLYGFSNHFEKTEDDVPFNAVDYYKPSANNTYENAKELYREMQRGNDKTCPAPRMTIDGNLIYGNGVLNDGISCLCIDSIEYGNVSASITEIADNIEAYSSAEDNALLAGTGNYVYNMINLFFTEQNKPSSDFKIVAPFAFSFGTINTEDGNRIVITNNSNTMRIIFNNVANWFCAGEPDGNDYVGHGKSTENQHYTIVGATKNATINGGAYGSIIGYGYGTNGNEMTTVEFQLNKNGSYESVSFEDFFIKQSDEVEGTEAESNDNG